MALPPTSLPEMRDVPCSEEILKEVAAAEQSFDTQLEQLVRQIHKPHGKREIVMDTSLDNVGVAMVATLRCKPLTLAAQWLLRQRYLRAGWDEVEFEPGHDSFYGERMTRVLLIEHKYKGQPRSICQNDQEYSHKLSDNQGSSCSETSFPSCATTTARSSSIAKTSSLCINSRPTWR